MPGDDLALSGFVGMICKGLQDDAKFCSLVTLSLSLCAASSCFLEAMRYRSSDIYSTVSDKFQIPNSKSWLHDCHFDLRLVSPWCASSTNLFAHWDILLVTFIGPVQTVSGIHDNIPIDVSKCEETQLSCEGIFLWEEYLLKGPNEYLVQYTLTKWDNY